MSSPTPFASGSSPAVGDITITTASVFKGIYNLYSGAEARGLASGFTFKAGQAGTFSAVAAGTQSYARLTAGGAHTLAVGDIVFIIGVADTYDGAHVVLAVSDDTHFDIDVAAGATTTGIWSQPSSFIASTTTSGIFKVRFNAEITVGTTDTIHTIKAFNNKTAYPSIAMAVSTKAGTTANLSAEGLMTIHGGDVISFAITDAAGSDTISVGVMNVTIQKLGAL